MCVDLKEFLQLVTPDGLRCVSVKYDVGFSNMPAHDIDDAIRIIETADSKKLDVYFALASYKETQPNKYQKIRVPRKRRNIEALKALWLDIDLKDLPEGKEITHVLQEFLGGSGFLKPSAMVHSGNGVHLYWPLSESVSFDRWKSIAEPFKQMCQDAGLPADHGCTADGARVLRPITTHNWKDSANPKPVRWMGGSGRLYEFSDIERCFPAGNVDSGSTKSLSGLPEYLAKKTGGSTSEYTKKSARPQNIRQVFRKCGVMRHILRTGGAEQDEPEWNATLMLLAHLDGGGKLVHTVSKGHPHYDADTTAEKWQQKVEAVEDGSGPTLCSTFEGYHPSTCTACPFYKSKKIKTPKSLAYIEDPTPAPKQREGVAGRFVPVEKNVEYPKGWREDGNGFGLERKVWDPKEKEEIWVQALRHVWKLRKASRSIQEKDYKLVLLNSHRGNLVEIALEGELLGTSNRLTEALARFGAPIVDGDELKNFKALMSTWLDNLRATNRVEDTTDQLGWIEHIDEEKETTEVIGFACGTHAFYRDGTERSGVVTANSKQKGVVQSFTPTGNIDIWAGAMKFLTRQGCMHILAMVASAFAGPLIRFTGQAGGVLAVVSEDSGAGKSTGMSVAQAVWGDPANGPATIEDTPTVVKNKIAYLQNITAYWDEIRGDDDVMNKFVQIAFQVSQGRDRERANQKAETIRAQTWSTMLATASNDSLYDIAAGKLGDSDAGIYRIFELKVGSEEFPKHDAEITFYMSELRNNFGHAGKVYAKWLVDNYERLGPEIKHVRETVEQAVQSTGPERFWIATVTALIMGAKYANEAGLANFDVKELKNYLVDGLNKLRMRTFDNRTQLEPKELLAAYAMQHQDGRVIVDFIPGFGGDRSLKPSLQGSHSSVRKVSYVLSTEQNKMRVLKSDFIKWLKTSKNMRWNDRMKREFKEQMLMEEHKAILAAGTRFKVPQRAMTLTFTIDTTDIEEAPSDA